MSADALVAYVREAGKVLDSSDSTLIQVRALEKLSNRR